MSYDPTLAITPGPTGLRLTATTSVKGQVPFLSGTVNPKMVRVVATATAYIRFGPNSGLAAVNTDLAVQVGDSVVLNVSGQTDPADGKLYAAAISETGTAIVIFTPLADF